jgi:hypothetical protein
MQTLDFMQNVEFNAKCWMYLKMLHLVVTQERRLRVGGLREVGHQSANTRLQEEQLFF